MPNRLDNLVPPYGYKWRGSTIDIEGTWMSGRDPKENFEDVWNQPLHIFRTFKSKSNPEIRNELPWIESGGILFYSIQPSDYETYGPGEPGEEGQKDGEIRRYAQEIKKVSPNQVMVPVGFEPDQYVNEEEPEKYRGTPEQYKAMYRHFIDVFREEEVDNVVWVMDYSYGIRLDPDLAVRLWPGPEVQWLFFNVF